MSDEVEWIDWHPKVGDVRPAVYRWKMPADKDWEQGLHPGAKVHTAEINSGQLFQIPAPTPTEDRPPWIDPQCKFRWGDRVKVLTDSRVGKVAYVINPHDLSYAGFSDENRKYTVLVAKSLGAAVPYETAGSLRASGKWLANYEIDRLAEDELELYPEDLPQHYDDRLLDADGPQEVGSLAQLLNDRFTEVWEKALAKHYGPRTPREIWINLWKHGPGEELGCIFYSSEEARMISRLPDYIRTIHFREVL